MAVLVYFLFKQILGLEITSWVCMLGALPFILLGFIKYNGMPLEKFIYAFIKSEILTPRNLKFKAVNIYDELMKNYFMNRKKEELKSDKINIKHKKQEKEKYKIPRSVQDTIPIKTIWKDGIFLVEQNKYELTF